MAGVGTTGSALTEDGVLDIDPTISLETTWHDMEKLVSMGLVRSIGIRFILFNFHAMMDAPELSLKTFFFFYLNHEMVLSGPQL